MPSRLWAEDALRDMILDDIPMFNPMILDRYELQHLRNILEMFQLRKISVLPVMVQS